MLTAVPCWTCSEQQQRCLGTSWGHRARRDNRAPTQNASACDEHQGSTLPTQGQAGEWPLMNSTISALGNQQQ